MSVGSRLGSIARVVVPLALRAGSVALLLVVSVLTAAAQQESGGGARSQAIAFDIRPQDLARALDAYAAATGMQILYESSLVSGRVSAEVKGDFEPHAALQALLAGTGLTGQRTDVDAVTLFPYTRGVGADIVPPDAFFLGPLQASITDALCRRAETRPGGYRAALQLWLTPAGAIQRASLLSSTGDAQRDAAFAGALNGITVNARPPPNMTQPITMVVVPRPSECNAR